MTAKIYDFTGNKRKVLTASDRRSIDEINRYFTVSNRVNELFRSFEGSSKEATQHLKALHDFMVNDLPNLTDGLK